MHLHTTDQYNERHSTIFHSGLQKFCSITPLIIVAVLLTCIQVAIAMSYSSGSKISERYLALRNWDARGYERIASEGYVWNAKMTEADVVWYPGHPIVIRIIQYLTHSSWRFSTLLASQVACVLFWTYFLLFLRRFIIPFYLQILSVTAVLFYPTSFYLISGYSEALFLGSILGMLYWMHDEGKYSLALAIAFAFIVSSTRITAIALIPLPLFFGLVHRRWWSGLFLALALGIGSLLYFAFLYVAFDNFFLYFHVSHAGWGTTPMGLQDLTFQYLWFREPVLNIIKSIMIGNGFALSAFLFVIVANGLLALVSFDLLRSICTRDRSIVNRLDFYFCALAILYLSFTGTFTIGMPSMSRYTLPVIVLGLLGFLHLLSRNQEIEFFKKFSELTMPTAIVFFAPLHVMYVHHYIIGHGWVY